MKKPYSPAEENILKFLRKKRGKRVTTLEIVDYHYAGAERRPRFARHTIVTTMSNLVRKVEENKEDFRVHHTDRSGPHPHEYWLTSKEN